MHIDRHLEEMSVREKVGQLLLAKSYGEEGVSEADRRAVTDLAVGSIGGNDVGPSDASPAANREYVTRLQELACSTGRGVPLLFDADFEYGVGQKYAFGTEFPQAMGIGATRSPEHARRAARITAREARSLGVAWNNAPCADVNTCAENPVIGWRSFGDDPDLVGDMVEAQVRGSQLEGVIATACHFPGHGDATEDSHHDLPRLECDRETLDAVHLEPFRRAVDVGVDAVMTGHLVVECLDDSRPASLSPAAHDLLREELGFEGIVVTDALRMDAIADRWEMPEAAVLAIEAGADVVMALCPYETLLEVSDRLVEAVKTGRLAERRVDESVRRVLLCKRAYGHLDATSAPPEPGTEAKIGRERYRAASQWIARDAVTLATDHGVLPLEQEGSVLVAGRRVDPVAAAVARHAEGKVIATSGEDPRGLPAADRAIVHSDGHADLVAELAEREAPVVVIEAGTPYDATAYRDDADAIAFAYDTTFEWADGADDVRAAAVDVIFGRRPRGRLPVRIDDEWPFGHGLTAFGD